MAIQRMRLLVPPTLKELLEDSVYERYFSRNPKRVASGHSGMPWRLMARRMPDSDLATWAMKDYASYADAWRRALRMVDDPRWEDVCVFSRVTFFKPPLNFRWSTGRFSWCGRCRRPTLYREMRWHPALRGAAVVDDNKHARCYYCGVRETLMPRYHPRLKETG